MEVAQGIKMYFHVLYGGERRRYGGVRRNSLHNVEIIATNDIKPNTFL